MQHSYLRYECADAFGLVSATSSSKIPASNSCLAFATRKSDRPVIMTTAGSHCVGFHLRTMNPSIKLGHREENIGGLGSGKALNGSQVVCIDVAPSQNDECHIATGWVDGAVRVFTIKYDELNADRGIGLAHTLVEQEGGGHDSGASCEPLVLNGHSGSPVRSITLDATNGVRLASGSSDGAVVLWDIVEECGLFRLLGHRGGVTDIHFANLEGGLLDALVTSSLDGLVKVWDLNGQCCIQTVASHRGRVWTSACLLGAPTPTSSARARLVTADDDGVAKVWTMNVPPRHRRASQVTLSGSGSTAMFENSRETDHMECCRFMGSISLPPGIQGSSEHVSCVRFHPQGKHLGVHHVNSKVIHIYAIRSTQEAHKRMQRRINRRNHKSTGSVFGKVDANKSRSKKRGILDDEEKEDLNALTSSASKSDEDPEKIKVSDEFEYIGTLSASHKIRSFVFVPWKEAGSVIRAVCSLATNALETLSLQRLKLGLEELLQNLESITSHMYPVHIKLSERGTREGHILLLDVASGELVLAVEKAHQEAIWSIDVKTSVVMQSIVSVATGSADKFVKFWDIETKEDEGILISHARTLEMSDDVVGVKFSHSSDPAKRMVFVSTMDSTVKIFFEDTLKFFLCLYGHKLPALALDASDDDLILATSGADKLVKIWGLDFGDTHRTLHGHDDSVTDLRFIRRTHNFFTSSKDGSLRYWDGDRFEQILVLHGHFAEVSSLAISRTGAFVLSAGMDRQVRVWERTKDIVFLQEEKALELERAFDRVDGRAEETTGDILGKNGGGEEDDDEEPRSASAVKQNLLSITAGDRIMAAIETADQELKIISHNKRPDFGADRRMNPLLLGMEPTAYVFWVLRSVKHSELEQSLLVLSIEHVSRLLYYMVALLRKGHGVELCTRVAVFVVKTHQNQIQANSWTLTKPLQELRRLLRLRLEESRCVVGFNLSGLQSIRNNSVKVRETNDGNVKDIWAGLALGR